MEFSFSTKIPSPPQAAELAKSAFDDALVVASVDGIATQVGENQVLFQSQEDGRTQVIDANVLAVLGRCRQFRSLQAHVEVLLADFPQFKSDQAPLRKLLQQLLDLNLLIPAQTVLARLSRSVPETKQASIAGAVIRTCDRPEQLRRLLVGVGSAPSPVVPHYLVLDDSSQGEHRRQNRSVVAEAKTSGIQVHYLGLEWQNAFIESLIQVCPEHVDEIRFLLAPKQGSVFSGGRLNNLATLLCAGHRFINLDDDMLPNGRVDGAFERPMLLAPRYDDAVGFFATAEATGAAGQVFDGDLLTYHLGLCGRTLSSVLSAQSKPTDCELKEYFLSDISRSGPDAPILSTLGGIYGNPGTGSTRWLYLLQGEAQRAFFDAGSRYTENLRTPHLWHTAQRPTLIPFPTFTATSLDDSVLVPPTLPTRRGEDFLLGTLLKGIHPGSLSLATPLALEHRWPAARDVDGDLQQPLALELPRFVADYLDAKAYRMLATDATVRLQHLGSELLDLAHGSIRKLRHLLLEYAMQARGDLISQLRGVSASANHAPPDWRSTVDAMIETNMASLVQGGHPDLGDWNRYLDDSAAREQLRAELGTFGSALQIWPSVWAHCQGRLPEALKPA